MYLLALYGISLASNDKLRRGVFNGAEIKVLAYQVSNLFTISLLLNLTDRLLP